MVLLLLPQMDYWINDPTCQSDVQFVLKMIFITVQTRSSSLELQASLVSSRNTACTTCSSVRWQGRDGTALPLMGPVLSHHTEPYREALQPSALVQAFTGTVKSPAPPHPTTLLFKAKLKVLWRREHYTIFT